MVEYVIAAEFDNQFGTCIRDTYPVDFNTTSERLLVDYLMPDGMHRNARDSLSFRSFLPISLQGMEEEVQEINNSIGLIKLYHILGNEKVAFGKDGQNHSWNAQIVNLKFLRIWRLDLNNVDHEEGKTEEKYILIHDGVQLKKVEGRVYSLRAEDDSVYLLEFEDVNKATSLAECIKLLEYNLQIARKLDLPDNLFYKHGWFYCIAHNRKEERDDRGSLYRSITIFSSKINSFENFIDIIEEGTLQFSTLPPFSMWKDEQKITLQSTIKGIYKQINEQIKESGVSRFKMAEDMLLDSEVQHGVTFEIAMNGSILSFINRFKEKTMHIYRALLEEKRVVVFGEKMTTHDICQGVFSCLALMRPLNIIDKIYPIEHIQSIGVFNDISSYVLGFSNPIIKNPKYYSWDLLIDLKESKLYGSNGEVLTKDSLSYLDKRFSQKLMSKITNEALPEQAIAKIFSEYTNRNVELFLNRAGNISTSNEPDEILDYIYDQSTKFKKTSFFTSIDLSIKNEREVFKDEYGDDYLPVYQGYKYLTETESMEGLDLMMAMTSLSTYLITPEQKSFFLRKIKRKTGTLDCITVGLMCAETETRRSTAQLVSSLEGVTEWSTYMNESCLFRVLLVNDALSLIKTN